jgi:HlyD family secretion protein
MKKTGKKIWIITGVIAAVVVLFVFLVNPILQARAAANSDEIQTVEISRDNLVAEVGGTGTVRANQSVQLSWQTSGRVDDVHVALLDNVQTDEHLAELLESSLSQSIILSESELINAERRLDDLLASNATTAQAQLALAKAEIALEDAEEDRESKKYQRASSATLDGIRADLILAQQTLDDAKEFYSAFEDSAETDVGRAAALSQLSNAQKAYDRANYNLQYAEALPEANEVAEAEAEVEVAQANLADAQREWERVKEGADDDDITAAEAQVSAAQAAYDLRYITAPFAGTVTDMDLLPGDQVTMGTYAMRVDDLSRLLVEVGVPEVDINLIAIGQPVRLTFDAIQGEEYNGEVVKVAQVGTVTQGGVDFTVTIELTDPDELVRPGMTAAVNIITYELSDILIIPNRSVERVDGKQVVYKVVDGKYEPVKVTLGASQDSYSQVLSGDLKEGDTIVANPSKLTDVMDAMPGAPRPGAGGGGF